MEAVGSPPSSRAIVRRSTPTRRASSEALSPLRSRAARRCAPSWCTSSVASALIPAIQALFRFMYIRMHSVGGLGLQNEQVRGLLRFLLNDAARERE